MKALSLRQPFAKLIVDGKKTIEIRNWNTSFRGKFLIHAAKKVMWDDCKKLKVDPNRMFVGAVIGSAELVDVKIYENKKDFRRDFDKHLADNKYFDKPCYGFVLKNAERIKAFEYKGMLGFFEVECGEQKKKY